VTVRHSKTDQEGAGAVVPIARGAHACPVAALRAWLAAAGITEGPVFRPVSKDDRPRAARLTPYSVGQLVKAYAERAGYDPATFGGHSLRAGFLTSAAERGEPLDRMMAVSRHKRVHTVLGYVRRADDFKDHAGAGLLRGRTRRRPRAPLPAGRGACSAGSPTPPPARPPGWQPTRPTTSRTWPGR
jgi:hypothetical protein